jgi:hypothetical protein
VDEEDPVKRLAALSLLAIAGVIYGLREPRPEPDVAPANSAPLASRVSRVIRDPARAPAASSAAPQGLAAGVAEAHATRACLRSGGCDYPDGDPHAYSFAVGRELAGQLRRLRETYGADAGSRGELEALARDMMSVDDGYVQAEAMSTFALYPPSPENLRAMVSGLDNTYDPLLVSQALEEWKRYLGAPEEPLVVDAIAHLVARGGQFTGEAASAGVDGFLNDRTVPAFRQTLAAMLPNTAAAKNLRRALAQYDRQAAGG